MIVLSSDMIVSMAKIREMIKDVHKVVDNLEEAFDSCDSNTKSMDDDISRRAKKAYASASA